MLIAHSKISGKGIFAARSARKGQLLLTMKGAIRHKRYRARVGLRWAKNWVAIGHDLWIDPKFPIRYMNHCCEPNAGFRTPTRLYALRDIEAGEEITFDYSAVDPELHWSMPCNCEALICRASIRSIQFLPDHVYRRYLPYVPVPHRRLRQKSARATAESN